MDGTILRALRERLLTRAPLDTIPVSVWKRAAALNTWGTNAIEGNTLTRDEVERLLLEQRSVGNRPVPDVIETIQHEPAFRGLLRRRAAPIRLTTVLELHEEVFRGIKADAGQWRRVNVRITGSRVSPPRMEKVVSRMDAWAKAYASRDLRDEGVFELASWMHFEFEAVHPFADGNGRVGRLLLNLHFLKHDWPPVHVLPPDRETYLRGLEAGHADDLAPLAEFLRVAMARSLLDLLDQVGTKEDALTPVAVLARGGSYSAKYLALRMSQGRLPGLKVTGDWQSSPFALRAYRQELGRER